VRWWSGCHVLPTWRGAFAVVACVPRRAMRRTISARESLRLRAAVHLACAGLMPDLLVEHQQHVVL